MPAYLYIKWDNTTRDPYEITSTFGERERYCKRGNFRAGNLHENMSIFSVI